MTKIDEGVWQHKGWTVKIEATPEDNEMHQFTPTLLNAYPPGETKPRLSDPMLCRGWLKAMKERIDYLLH